jgi:hypothetical protein
VELKDTDALSWLTDMAPRIQEMLEAESLGRGLIFSILLLLQVESLASFRNCCQGSLLKKLADGLTAYPVRKFKRL